mgnify:CR=1 FL=1
MKCENCGMGFIITPINVDKVCPHCGHIHGDSEVSNKEDNMRSEEHTSELQSPCNLVCRLLLEKKQEPQKNKTQNYKTKKQTNALKNDN